MTYLKSILGCSKWILPKSIFEKFHRVGNEETRSQKGTGLGLYIVKEICKAHKAEINISDNTPLGSRFQITFSK